eukprot:CAMPEP_0118974262 /NCGR_PEP_ID=MMETSP1173-20130426/11159_1 /TAXON_ID=1034831 /ORGANISM="Rhizochromulina marina cf, Strain CCMP1243" /LENGTH=234 /DNA_ID=CAMNT_0006923977 /DNA_START=11 /DNA_END=715 /DNA_ORIENTATION=+
MKLCATAIRAVGPRVGSHVARPTASSFTRSLSTSAAGLEFEDYGVFPRERPGLNYNLNWSLNKNGVTPAGDAFHLTKARDVEKLSLSVEKVTKPKASEAAPEAGESALSFADFDGALAAAKDVLEGAKTLYVAEGDAPGTRTQCRVITDSATIAATAMTSILERAPKREEVPPLPITCYVSTEGSPFEGFVVEQGDGVIYCEGETVASVVLTGANYKHSKLAATISRAAEALKE